MNIGAFIAQANRAQKTRPFKVVASSVIGVLAVGLAIWVFLSFAGQATEIAADIRAEEGFPSDPTSQLVADIVAGQDLRVVLYGAIFAGLAVSLAWIWLGSALNALAILVGGMLPSVALYLFEPTRTWGVVGFGITSLTLAFIAALELTRLLLSPSYAVTAIARTALTEAVRLKLPMVFIVGLILGLAALPVLLDPETFLRYRVQAFLQWGTGGTFWVLAVLVLLFGVSTVTNEQRQRVIWQTMTKPVSAWQYLLGKWLGVSMLAAVLLAVCSSGVFLFTDYLSRQPARGEISAGIPDVGEDYITDDRLILETRVLTARVGRPLDTPPEMRMDSEEFKVELQKQLELERLQNPGFAPENTPTYRRFASDFHLTLLRAYRTIGPGGVEDFEFSGLEQARRSGRPLSVTYRINAEGNRPDRVYKLTMMLSTSGQSVVRDTSLGTLHTWSIAPEYIDDDGVLRVRIFNGEIVTNGSGGLGIVPNENAIRIDDEQFEVAFVAGSWQLNYLRGMLVLWIKLSALAMLGVYTGSFLSFSVASLVSFAAFALAEMSTFLAQSVEYYGVADSNGQLVWYKFITSNVAAAIGNALSFYANLNPTRDLISGYLIPWSAFATGIFALVALAVVMFALGVFAMRSRELAVYSGN